MRGAAVDVLLSNNTQLHPAGLPPGDGFAPAESRPFTREIYFRRAIFINVTYDNL